MGDSSAGEGPSNIKNLKTLIEDQKKKFHELHPNDKRWPCPFCYYKSRTQIKCRIHIMKEHTTIYNANEHEFSLLMDENTLYLSESDSISFVSDMHDSQLLEVTQAALQVDTQTIKKNPLQCDVCSKIFKTVKGAKTHSIKCKSLSKLSTDVSYSQLLDNADNLKKCPHCPNNSRKLYNGNRGLKIHHSRKHKNITFVENNYSHNSMCNNVSIANIESILAHFNRNIRVIKRIPKSARITGAYELARLMDICVMNNDLESWENLLCFAYRAFQIPIRKSKSESLARLVKHNIKNLTDPIVINHAKKTTKNSSLSLRVEAKVSEGDVRGAVKLLLSTDSLATDDTVTCNLLKEKHPLPSRQLVFPNEPDETTIAMVTTVETVLTSIFSFHNGSSAGIDGISPQHLKDLTASTNGEAGTKLITSLTKLTNLMLSGKVNKEICKVLYGARLIALTKKDKGIRPIAVGSTYRRLTAKIACKDVRDLVSSYLKPTQIGFSIKGGCEAAVHACRTYIKSNRGNRKVILKIDFKNAFNSVERDEMLRNIRMKSPSIYPFMWQCYSSSSILFFGKDQIMSEVGAQQGDPCGPLAFSLIIQPIIENLLSELNIWYLDDGTLGGDPETILNDLKYIIQECKKIGLEINPAKCELFFCGDQIESVIQDFNAICSGIKVVANDLELLGSPISEGSEEKLILKKHSELKVMFERLNLLNCHTAYFLLKICFTVPKLTYMLRSSPCFRHGNLLKLIDDDIKRTFESIANCRLNDEQWSKVSMPIRFGGMGIRKCEDIALPAFLSSINSVINLVTLMLPNIHDETMIADYTDALNEWSFMSKSIPETKMYQNVWDDLIMSDKLKSLIFHSTKDKARHLASLHTESNAWLAALPSKFVGTFLDNNTFRISTALRIGSDICKKHKCICGDMVSSDGTHGLSCSKSAGRHPRHAELNTIIQNALQSAIIPSKREPEGMFRDDGKRVDGVTLVSWSRGQLLVWDATCSDTLAPSYLSRSSVKSGTVAELAASNKLRKYKGLLEQNYLILPFAVETLGVWCSEAISFIDKLGKMMFEATGEKNSKTYLKQRISLAIQRSNAASVMATFDVSDNMNEIFYIL